MINLIGPLDLYSSKVCFNHPSYFIDGGIKHKHKFSNPKFSFGDGDSSNAPLDTLLEQDKDYSDYLFTLEKTIDLDSQISLHGLYGKRVDHQLAIIGDTLSLLNKYPNKEIFLANDSEEMIIFSSHQHKFYEIGPNFSVFTLNEQEIQIKGAKYPLDNQQIEDKMFKLSPFSSRGLSNKVTHKLEVTAQKPFMIVPYLDD